MYVVKYFDGEYVFVLICWDFVLVMLVLYDCKFMVYGGWLGVRFIGGFWLVVDLGILCMWLLDIWCSMFGNVGGIVVGFRELVCVY